MQCSIHQTPQDFLPFAITIINVIVLQNAIIFITTWITIRFVPTHFDDSRRYAQSAVPRYALWSSVYDGNWRSSRRFTSTWLITAREIAFTFINKQCTWDLLLQRFRVLALTNLLDLKCKRGDNDEVCKRHANANGCHSNASSPWLILYCLCLWWNLHADYISLTKCEDELLVEARKCWLFIVV